MVRSTDTTATVRSGYDYITDEIVVLGNVRVAIGETDHLNAIQYHG
jgi:hypothetical protein